MRLQTYSLRQSTKDGCGRAALQSLISYVQKDRNYLKVPLSKNADNFLRMTLIASKHGITLEARRVTTIQKLRHERGPLILQLKMNQKLHFVTVQRFLTFYIVNDPSSGSYLMTEKMLARYFTLNYLAVKRSVKKKYQQPPKIKINIFPLYIVSFSFVVLLFSAFFFLGQVEHIMLAYVLFALIFLLYIVERFLRLALFQKFDMTVIAPKIKLENIKNIKKFQQLMEAKVNLFSFTLNKFSLLLNLTLIATLFIINGPVFIIIVTLLIIFALCAHLIALFQVNKDYNIAIAEEALFTSEQSCNKENYLTIIRTTNNVVAWREFTNIIFYFGLFIMTFFIMHVAMNYHLNFFLFYFFAFVYIFEEAKKLLKLRTKRADYYLAHFLINDLV